MHAHARFDGLDLDARLQWVGKGKNSVFHYFDELISKQQAVNLLQRSAIFLRDLDFANVYTPLDQLVC